MGECRTRKTAQDWPGWFTDSQLAAEHAQHLAARLSASVNAGLLAQGWLDQYGPQAEPVAKARRQQSQQQRKRRPAPRQYLTQAGVTAAIYAVLAALLAVLWSAAAALGWASAVTVLGVGALDGYEQALEDLLAAGETRIGWMVRTRVRRLERVLMDALRDGTSVDDLAELISAILSSLTSASLVTQSEVTWASGWAAYRAYKKAGITWKRWQTRNDALVCPVCKKNQDAGSIPIDTRFPSGDLHPLAHPRCVIGSTRVVVPQPRMAVDEAHGDTPNLADSDFRRWGIRAVSSREYVGDVVTIRTASGKELTATPNHPIASPGGWVPIAEIAVGDHVLCSTNAEWEAAPVNPDKDQVPARIKDIAQALPVILGGVPTASEDFHGDGAGSEVCVIRADSLLVDYVQPSAAEHLRQHKLGMGNVAARSPLALNAKCLGDQELGGLGLAAGSSVGCCSEMSALGRAGVAHARKHGLAASAGRDTSVKQDHANCATVNAKGGSEGFNAFAGMIPGDDLGAKRAHGRDLLAVPELDSSGFDTSQHNLVADAEGFCDYLEAFASDIAADEVVHVERIGFVGHVYNLDTRDGWYIGNGIVTHNCRCVILPGAPPRRQGGRSPSVSPVGASAPPTVMGIPGT